MSVYRNLIEDQFYKKDKMEELKISDSAIPNYKINPNILYEKQYLFASDEFQ
jgi:hypothetical protein